MDEVTRRYLLEQAEEELKAIWKRTEYLNNEDIEWQFSFLKRKKFIFVPRTGRGCANPLSRKSSVLARRHVPYRLLCTELDEGPEDHDYCQSATFSGFPPEAQDEAMRHVFLSRDAERKVAVDVETIDETEQCEGVEIGDQEGKQKEEEPPEKKAMDIIIQVLNKHVV